MKKMEVTKAIRKDLESACDRCKRRIIWEMSKRISHCEYGCYGKALDVLASILEREEKWKA